MFSAIKIIGAGGMATLSKKSSPGNKYEIIHFVQHKIAHQYVPTILPKTICLIPWNLIEFRIRIDSFNSYLCPNSSVKVSILELI